jgi:hypothetical protein
MLFLYAVKLFSYFSLVPKLELGNEGKGGFRGYSG